MIQLGRLFITLGIGLLIAGIVILFAGRLPFNLLNLPGDIQIRRPGFTFYFPITTSIVVSILLSVIFYLLRRIGG